MEIQKYCLYFASRNKSCYTILYDRHVYVCVTSCIIMSYTKKIHVLPAAFYLFERFVMDLFTADKRCQKSVLVKV